MALVKPKTDSHLIYQGDDYERLVEMRKRVDVAERVAAEEIERASEKARTENARSGDLDPIVEARKQAEAEVKPLRDEYDALVAEAAERALEIRVRHIGPKRFAQLVLEHPPRTVTEERPAATEGEPPTLVEVVHPDDRLWSVNTETFPWALLQYVDPETLDPDNPDDEVRTIVDPRFDNERRLQRFLEDEVPEGEFDQIWVKAFLVNRQPSADPKASTYSTGSRTSSVET